MSDSRWRPASWMERTYSAPAHRVRVGREGLGEADHRVERRAQLVAHGGEEARLGVVRGLRRVLGALQLGADAALVGEVGVGAAPSRRPGSGRRPPPAPCRPAWCGWCAPVLRRSCGLDARRHGQACLARPVVAARGERVHEAAVVLARAPAPRPAGRGAGGRCGSPPRRGPRRRTARCRGGCCPASPAGRRRGRRPRAAPGLLGDVRVGDDEAAIGRRVGRDLEHPAVRQRALIAGRLRAVERQGLRGDRLRFRAAAERAVGELPRRPPRRSAGRCTGPCAAARSPGRQGGWRPAGGGRGRRARWSGGCCPWPIAAAPRAPSPRPAPGSAR